MTIHSALSFFLMFCAISVQSLNNGLGLTPPMGFSSWNAVSSNVTEQFMKNITTLLIKSGKLR
jgi:hypothetical protein